MSMLVLDRSGMAAGIVHTIACPPVLYVHGAVARMTLTWIRAMARGTAKAAGISDSAIEL